jgi:hypothetical protein
MAAEMISLTDAQLAAVIAACQPLQPAIRDQFLRDVAAELETYPPIADGSPGA